MAMEAKHRCLWMLALLMVCTTPSAADAGRLITQGEEKMCENSNEETLTHEFVTETMAFEPGTVHNAFYFPEAPAERFATRDFVAEMVMEDGATPVPLFETYLHHWLMYEYAVPKSADRRMHKRNLMAHLRTPHAVGGYPDAPDSWLLVQQFGVGAETRHTDTRMPAPFGFEGGDRFGENFDSVWVLNVHAIDTRGAIERMACTECRCDVFDFNKTGDAHLPEGYHGGLACCQDGAMCHVGEAFQGHNGEKLARNLRFRYTWSWTPWDDCVEPLTNIRLDVTEVGFGAQLEYEVTGCDSNDPNDEDCIDTRVSYQRSPVSGPLISAVGHFHARGISAAIWGEDGRLLCESLPIYGTSSVVGNEAGYVVGITACWPPESTGVPYYIRKNEMLKFQVKYSKVDGPHTGLMGLINLKIATGRNEKSPM